jgi:hypothetical protein
MDLILGAIKPTRTPVIGHTQVGKTGQLFPEIRGLKTVGMSPPMNNSYKRSLSTPHKSPQKQSGVLKNVKP